MTDTTRTGADFDAGSLRTWTEPGAGRRRALSEKMGPPPGSLHISSPALTVTGTADIAEHINRVHNDRIAGQGLIFSYDQRMESGDALLLRWSMTARSGDVVGLGVDTVFRDVDGKVTRAYMFMGVN